MTFTNLKSLCLAITMLAILPLSDVFSQNLVNAATGTVNNTGTLRIRAAAGQFQNGAVIGNVINATGTIEFTGNGTFTDLTGSAAGATALGVDASMRVPGKTLWSGTAAQTPQARWYTDLFTSGAGTKTYGTGIYYVSDEYSPTGGDRDYVTSTFYYDGTAAQTIFPENGASGNVNIYYNLLLKDVGAKDVATETTVNVENNLGIEATNTAAFTITGTVNSYNTTAQAAGAGDVTVNGTLNLGAGISTFDDGVVVAGALASLVTDDIGVATFNSTLNVNALGTFNVKDGDAVIGSLGTMTLADAATAVIDVDAGRTLTVTGAFVNSHAAAVNLTFDPTSTILYDGAAQNIVVTTLANQFGHMTLENGAKTSLGSIFMVGNFSLADNNLTIGNSPADALNMSTPAATATYADGEEVVGRMRRTYLAATDAYTFNNTNTIVTFTDDADAGDYMDFTVQPGVAPSIYDGGIDVERKIVVDFNLTAFATTIRAGYKLAEAPDFTGNGVGLDIDDLKFFESDGTTIEKLAGSGAYVRSVADPIRYIQLPGIIAGAAGAVDGIVEKGFTATHELQMRASNQMYSIASGRWSNPATWDEYREPTSDDNVTISTTTQVHAGGAGTGGDRDVYATAEAYREGGIAGGFVKTITIQTNSALVMGNTNYDYFLTTGGTITNNASATPTTVTFAAFLGENVADYDGRGLIIYEGTLRSNTVTNNGMLWINTAAEVEVGD